MDPGEILLSEVIDEESDWKQIKNTDTDCAESGAVGKNNDVEKITGKCVQITFDHINRNMDRKMIKEFFQDYSRVKSVHYTKLQVQGYIKFHEEDKLEEDLAVLLNKKLIIDNTKCSIKIIYLKTFAGNNLENKRII